MKKTFLLGLLGSIVAAGAVVAGTVLRPGQWMVKKNAEVTMLALAAPECAVLILRCRASRPEVAMAVGKLSPGTVDISLRIPGATPDARAWRVASDFGEVVYPGDAARLVRTLRGAPRVLADALRLGVQFPVGGGTKQVR